MSQFADPSESLSNPGAGNADPGALHGSNLPPRPAPRSVSFGQGQALGFDKLGTEVAAFLSQLNAQTATIEHNQGIDYCKVDFAGPCSSPIHGMPLMKKIVFDKNIDFSGKQHPDGTIEVLSINGVRLDVGVGFLSKEVRPPRATIYPDGSAQISGLPKKFPLPQDFVAVIQTLVQNCNSLRNA